jgi:hypothetical protein
MGDTGTSAVLTRYEYMPLWPLRQNERSTVRDTLQHKRGDNSCCRAITRADGVRRLPQISQKMVCMGVITLQKCVFTSGNKVISELQRCCYYFLFNLVQYSHSSHDQGQYIGCDNWKSQLAQGCNKGVP